MLDLIVSNPDHCLSFYFQNHPRGSFLKLYKSCQVGIFSITPNFTSKIEHCENI